MVFNVVWFQVVWCTNTTWKLCPLPTIPSIVTQHIHINSLLRRIERWAIGGGIEWNFDGQKPPPWAWIQGEPLPLPLEGIDVESNCKEIPVRWSLGQIYYFLRKDNYSSRFFHFSTLDCRLLEVVSLVFLVSLSNTNLVLSWYSTKKDKRKSFYTSSMLNKIHRGFLFITCECIPV